MLFMHDKAMKCDLYTMNPFINFKHFYVTLQKTIASHQAQHSHTLPRTHPANEWYNHT